MADLRKNISSTSAIQIFNIARYATLLLCSILLTKSAIGAEVIGHYETFILISGTLSFFWVNGLTHTFLSTYHNYPDKKKVIGQTAILVIGLSICIALLILLLRAPIVQLFSFDDSGNVFYLLLAYFIFNNSSFLLDYILLAKGNTKGLLWLGVYHVIFQTTLVVLPAFYYGNFDAIINGLLIFIGIKFLITIFILFRNSAFRPDFAFIGMYLKKASPLIISFFLGGMSIYVDGIIVNNYYDKATFALYQYGAREFPISLLLANALSAAMILQIGKNINAVAVVKSESLKLMHRLFPLCIVLIMLSQWLYPLVFNPAFSESYLFFNIYMLLLVPRLIFPNAILLGLGENKSIMSASAIEFVLNIVGSLIFLQFFGIQGIAYGTVLAFVSNKLILLYQLKRRGISPQSYIPVKALTAYSVGLILVFVVFTYFV